MTDYPETSILDLDRRQIYPRGKRLAPEHLAARAPFRLDRKTPIASMGSCFAARIKRRLLDRGYRYVQTSDHPAARPASAAWGTVFNAFCVAQETARAAGSWDPRPGEWWHTDDGILSPWRKGVAWATREERDRELDAHYRDSRRAIQEADVFILTLGLAEVWYNAVTERVFYQVPPSGAFYPSAHTFRLSTVRENVTALEVARSNMGRIRGEVPRIIVTVSPVPLRATFQDRSAVEGNVRSKATLLLAAHEFAERHPDSVSYFPSFELVTTILPDPYKRDNRHVTPETEEAVMRLFEETYLS